MSRTRSFVPALAAAVALASAPQAPAASASDAGARVVVPSVQYDQATETTVFLENHETRDVEVQLRWVGERRSGTPGLRVCGRFQLPAGSLTAFDLRQSCSLMGSDELGTLVAMVTNPSGVARVSARGRVDLLDVVQGVVLQTLMVDGMPLGALDTTDSIHVASGLRYDPMGAAGAPVTTDCFFGTFVDGSGAGGVLARLGLRDRNGQVLGNDSYFSLRPFELLRLEDVFKLVGAPPGPWDDVRATFFLAGGGDAVLGYCTSAQTLPAKGARTLALSLAQVADPRDETRRRSVSVNSTPEAQGGAPFALQPAEQRVVHGLFVGHPDRLSCGVASSDALVLKAVSPDGAVSVGGTGSQTGWFDAGPRGQIAAGFSGLWGLEVSWDPSAARTAPASYTISCRSGNGVSLADELFRN